MVPLLVTSPQVDVLDDMSAQSWFARARAAGLVEAAIRVVAAARATRDVVARDRMRSATRRHVSLCCGSSDDRVEQLPETNTRTCPRCATTNIAGLGYGRVTPDGNLCVGFRCRQCEMRFFYVRSVPHLVQPLNGSQPRPGNNCRHVTIGKGSGRSCDECSEFIEPDHVEL